MEKGAAISHQISFTASPPSLLHLPNYALIIERSVAQKSKAIKEEPNYSGGGEAPGDDSPQETHAGALNKKKRPKEPDSSDYGEDSDMDEGLLNN